MIFMVEDFLILRNSTLSASAFLRCSFDFRHCFRFNVGFSPHCLAVDPIRIFGHCYPIREVFVASVSFGRYESGVFSAYKFRVIYLQVFGVFFIRQYSIPFGMASICMLAGVCCSQWKRNGNSAHAMDTFTIS